MTQPHPILEGLVTTFGPDRAPHLAPMGPRVSPDGRHLLLRPFPAAQTFRNLKAHGEGVFHITDDVLLLVRAALGQAALPPHRAAEHVRGVVLCDACRAHEFVVREIVETGERVHIDAEIVHSETLRDFWGFNRGKHAVLEAAILATRLQFLDLDQVAAEFARLRIIVDKTGGHAELEAFAFLQAHLEQVRGERSRT